MRPEPDNHDEEPKTKPDPDRSGGGGGGKTRIGAVLVDGLREPSPANSIWHSHCSLHPNILARHARYCEKTPEEDEFE